MSGRRDGWGSIRRIIISMRVGVRPLRSTSDKSWFRNRCHGSPLIFHRAKHVLLAESRQTTHIEGTTIFPAHSSMIMPKLKISASRPYLPRKISGARYSRSPSRSSPCSFPSPSNEAGRGHRDAIPKSPILSRPSTVMNMLVGFKSRWMTF